MPPAARPRECLRARAGLDQGLRIRAESESKCPRMDSAKQLLQKMTVSHSLGKAARPLFSPIKSSTRLHRMAVAPQWASRHNSLGRSSGAGGRSLSHRFFLHAGSIVQNRSFNDPKPSFASTGGAFRRIFRAPSGRAAKGQVWPFAREPLDWLAACGNRGRAAPVAGFCFASRRRHSCETRHSIAPKSAQ
jgi:hypothetical protein